MCSAAGATATIGVDDVFRLQRSASRTKEKRRATTAYARPRGTSSTSAGTQRSGRCVTVGNGDHLYLAGRSMIPTHNPTAAMDFARAASVRNNFASAISRWR